LAEKHLPEASTHIYGPVPSRRLGYSLGVDILPFKTCSLDCIYCQLGRSRKKTIQRAAYFDQDEILGQIQKAVAAGQQIDYITFSGSGEPTLNAQIGPLIRKIKKMTEIPVAVLTNGTLLAEPEVREALKAADLVVPSLDAVTQEIFERINRPHEDLQVEKMIEGLQIFRREFSGLLWLEVMLVKDLNDSPRHIQQLKETIALIDPDKVQLNTVVRPPAEGFAQSLERERLEEIRDQLGDIAEIVVDFPERRQDPSEQDIQQAVLAYLQRRPATLNDLSNSLGIHINEVIKHLDFLRQHGKIKLVPHKDRKYYEPV
jgi:wyosine [tRNA(Phe)-imidazoG37] synthetase (radical SAM superfamily)